MLLSRQNYEVFVKGVEEMILTTSVCMGILIVVFFLALLFILGMWTLREIDYHLNTGMFAPRPSSSSSSWILDKRD